MMGLIVIIFLKQPKYLYQILKIWEGRAYPYQVGNGSGTTGFYKAEALQKK